MGNLWYKKPKEINQQQSPVMQIGPLNDKTQITSLFFPSKISEQSIIETIKRARREMRICVFTITNNNIIGQVMSQIQSNKNLQVRIITDDVQTLIPSQNVLLEKIFTSGNLQVQIKVDNSAYSLMHNKYLVVDDEIVLTGSFNWTQKAVNCNKENIVIIEDKKTALQFIQNFEDLWAGFTPFRLGMKTEPKQVKLVKQKVTIEKTVKVKGARCKIELAIKKQITKRTAIKKIKNNKNGMLSSEYIPQKSEYLEESDEYE